jgi:hypothetical protein
MVWVNFVAQSCNGEMMQRMRWQQKAPTYIYICALISEFRHLWVYSSAYIYIYVIRIYTCVLSVAHQSLVSFAPDGKHTYRNCVIARLRPHHL